MHARARPVGPPHDAVGNRRLEEIRIVDGCHAEGCHRSVFGDLIEGQGRQRVAVGARKGSGFAIVSGAEFFNGFAVANRDFGERRRCARQTLQRCQRSGDLRANSSAKSSSASHSCLRGSLR